MANKDEHKPPGDRNRREFCKKVPCAAMGIMASPGVLASAFKESNHSKDQIFENEHIMANTITVKVISQKGN